MVEARNCPTFYSWSISNFRPKQDYKGTIFEQMKIPLQSSHSFPVILFIPCHRTNQIHLNERKIFATINFLACTSLAFPICTPVYSVFGSKVGKTVNYFGKSKRKLTLLIILIAGDPPVIFRSTLFLQTASSIHKESKPP